MKNDPHLSFKTIFKVLKKYYGPYVEMLRTWRAAKRYYGSQVQMFQAHNWPERGTKMMTAALKRINKDYGGLAELINYHEIGAGYPVNILINEKELTRLQKLYFAKQDWLGPLIKSAKSRGGWYAMKPDYAFTVTINAILSGSTIAKEVKGNRGLAPVDIAKVISGLKSVQKLHRSSYELDLPMPTAVELKNIGLGAYINYEYKKRPFTFLIDMILHATKKISIKEYGDGYSYLEKELGSCLAGDELQKIKEHSDEIAKHIRQLKGNYKNLSACTKCENGTIRLQKNTRWGDLEICSNYPACDYLKD